MQSSGLKSVNLWTQILDFMQLQPHGGAFMCHK